MAGPAVRTAALAIDSLIRFALYLALIPLLALSGLGLGLVLLGLFLLEWFYPVFFELRSGATPGKSAMGLGVVHDDGTPVGAVASVIRNLLRVADFLLLCYAAGLVSCMVDRDFRRLGDLATGTLVVHSEPRRGPRASPNARPAPCRGTSTSRPRAPCSPSPSAARACPQGSGPSWRRPWSAPKGRTARPPWRRSLVARTGSPAGDEAAGL